MSERVVGPGERELLDRARDRVVAQRRAYYRQLEDVTELDQRAVAEQTGDRSTERLLHQLWRIDLPEARRLLAEASDLVPRRALTGELLPPRYPHSAQVLAAGQISPAHLAIIRTTMHRLERVETLAPDTVAWAEGFLAEKAVELGPRALNMAARELLARLDPDGTAPDDDECLGDELRILTRRDGTTVLHATIRDSVDAALLRAGFATGATPAGPDDTRSLHQRQAEALKEAVHDTFGPHGRLADQRDHPDGEPDVGPAADGEPEAERDGEAGEDRGEDCGEDEPALIPEPRPADLAARRAAAQEKRAPITGAARALLTITIDHRWLRQAIGHGTLDEAALANPHTVRRWACDAEIIPMVLGSRSEPLDVGRLSRTVPDAIRRALNLRDGGCAFPGCTRRPRRCHAHHVDHWVDGGPTALDNLCLLCLFHHQLVHHGQWTVEMIDGLPWFTPPAWLDPQQHRRPGGRARVPADRVA